MDARVVECAEIKCLLRANMCDEHCFELEQLDLPVCSITVENDQNYTYMTDLMINSQGLKEIH